MSGIVSYLRVSAEIQAENNSVSGQRLALQLLCAARSWDYTQVTEYVDDGISGATADRPAYQQLKADIQANRVARLLVAEMDRISRDPDERSAFVRLCMEKGVAITEQASGDLDSKSPTGMLLERIRSALAEFQRSQIKARTKMGVRAKIASGVKWAGAKTYAPGRRGCASLTDAQKAQLSALALKGLGATAIAREMGITGRVASRWRLIVLRGAGSNPNNAVNSAPTNDTPAVPS